MEEEGVKQNAIDRNDVPLIVVKKMTVLPRDWVSRVPINFPRHHTLCRKNSCGFTLVELIIALAILGILTAISIPIYNNFQEKMRINQAKDDIYILGLKIQAYYSERAQFPDTLDDVGQAGYLDPWGNPYRYFRIASQNHSTVMQNARKDRFLVPINSTYDLYSMGNDGQSKKPLTAKASQDDIIRANDGGYVGLASDY